MTIPDDATMEAAIYGTSHLETILHKSNCEKILRILDDRIAESLSIIDIDLSEDVLAYYPELIHSSEEISRDACSQEVYDTIMHLRSIRRNGLAATLVTSWMNTAERRGRLIGLGEHSARSTASGTCDLDYKTALLKYGGL